MFINNDSNNGCSHVSDSGIIHNITTKISSDAMNNNNENNKSPTMSTATTMTTPSTTTTTQSSHLVIDQARLLVHLVGKALEVDARRAHLIREQAKTRWATSTNMNVNGVCPQFLCPMVYLHSSRERKLKLSPAQQSRQIFVNKNAATFSNAYSASLNSRNTKVALKITTTPATIAATVDNNIQ